MVDHSGMEGCIGRSILPQMLSEGLWNRNRNSFRQPVGDTNVPCAGRRSKRRLMSVGLAVMSTMEIQTLTTSVDQMADSDDWDTVLKRSGPNSPSRKEHKLTSIREELCRFIHLNEQEQWVPSGDVLEELEWFGDDLIPGLIECLDDGHPDIPHQAVQLLGAARPRSDAAVPALIKRMADEDWLVVTSVNFALGDFGPVAAAAIRRLSRGWNRRMSISVCWRRPPSSSSIRFESSSCRSFERQP